MEIPKEEKYSGNSLPNIFVTIIPATKKIIISKKIMERMPGIAPSKALTIERIFQDFVSNLKTLKTLSVRKILKEEFGGIREMEITRKSKTRQGSEKNFFKPMAKIARIISKVKIYKQNKSRKSK